jgi:hypothetical protein
VSKRAVATTALVQRNLATNRVILPSVAMVNSKRSYSNKKGEVTPTVDKFPGYIRNENYKQVRYTIVIKIKHDMDLTHTYKKKSSQSRMWITLKQLSVTKA